MGPETSKPRIRLEVSVLIAALLCAALLYMERDILSDKWEDLMLVLDRSPERAFVYGSMHFDANHRNKYDIDRAEYLLKEAEKRDPAFPYVNHQLARIAFLRADYASAIEHIDKEIAEHGKDEPNAYYVRALIYGYQGKYLEAAADYEKYFTLAPANWAGINDYAWVLLKADLPKGADYALSWGLKQWPENAWLLNNEATALYELGRFAQAKTTAEKAEVAIGKLTSEDWLNAYPGNDPLIAPQALASFKESAKQNLQKISARTAPSI